MRYACSQIVPVIRVGCCVVMDDDQRELSVRTLVGGQVDLVDQTGVLVGWQMPIASIRHKGLTHRRCHTREEGVSDERETA